jgi:hypothetical protein
MLVASSGKPVLYIANGRSKKLEGRYMEIT